MSARRGWCPGVFDPMPSGDGLLVRVKPPGMLLSAEAAVELAEAACRHGNGVIELTGRANLQIRGLSASSTDGFAAAMVAAGLAEADPEAERWRVVMSSPLAGDDPAVAPQTAAVASEIERRLISDGCFAALTPKFAVVVDGGGMLSLDDVRADVRVRYADGEFRVEGSIPPPSVGEAEVTVRRPDSFDLRHVPVGRIHYAQKHCGAFGIGVPFGAMRSADLIAAVRLAQQFGDGMLRATPWRVLLIGGVAEPAAPHLRRAAEELGMIVDAADPRCRVVACAGRPGCASASVPARADAETIARLIGGFGGLVHVSGCRKGCAHRGRAEMTLIGENGRYALVRGGTVEDAPQVAGLTIAGVTARLAAERA